MTENGLNIPTTLTKQTDLQVDRVLVCHYLYLTLTTENKKEEADSSHLLKFLFANALFEIRILENYFATE